MSEVLFSSGDIKITRAVAKFGNATYPIANIGSVIVEDETSSMFGAVIVVGIFAAFIIGVATNGFVGIGIFILALIVAGCLPKRKKITLKTSSGDVNALTSKDLSLVESVRMAIETAFSQKA